MTTVLASQTSRDLYVTALLLILAITIGLEAVYYHGGLLGEADETPLRAIAVSGVIAAGVTGVVWLLTHKALVGGSARELGKLSPILGCLALVSILGMWLGVFGPICVAAVMFGRKAVAVGATKSGYFGMVIGTISFAASALLLILAV